MRAAIFRATGPSHDVLSVEDVPAPEPGPGEVRVRVTRSGVNPTDWKDRARGTGPAGLPFKVPNQDGAGVVESVGAGVEPSRVGERVWIWFAAWQRQWGTAAELCVVPSEQAVALPDGASDEKAALARRAGAHEIVNYREEDATARIRELAPDGVDRIVEVALHDNVDLDAAVCAPNAVIAPYAAAGEVRMDVVRALMTRNVTMRFVLVYTLPRDALRHAIDDVVAAVAAGVLTELPFHHFPLEAIADAHDAVEAGVTGKVLVDVGEPGAARG